MVFVRRLGVNAVGGSASGPSEAALLSRVRPVTEAPRCTQTAASETDAEWRGVTEREGRSLSAA